MNFFFIIHNKLSIIVLVHLKSNNMGNLSYSICSALIYGGFLPKSRHLKQFQKVNRLTKVSKNST